MPILNSNPAIEQQRGETSSARGTTCEAHDLKRILNLLADQVADADRRHSDALADMQHRLAQLDTTTRDLKTKLPQEMTPVLDRIQGGMAAISDQISEQSALRQQSHDNVEPQPLAVAVAPNAPALRSALAAEALDAFARKSQAIRAGAPVPVDNFDVVDSASNNATPARDADKAESGFDEDAADALARHFETSGGNPLAAQLEAKLNAARPHAVAVIEPAMARTTPPAVTLAASAVLPAASRLASPEAPAVQPPVQSAAPSEPDRAWLESQFSAIAGRLESSLHDIGRNGTFESVDARFSQLEAKLTEALRTATKSPDTASLRGIEEQVEDLSAQLVSVQNHFSRLDTIELELRSLADRFKSDKMTKLFENGGDRAPDSDAIAGVVASRVAQEMPRIEQKLQALADSFSAEKLAGLVAKASAAPDATAIARLVAEQVAQSMPRQAEPASTPQLDQLRSMIETFVVEQRQGGEQTNSMLDTMQQAMISLLDRMDSIEQGVYAPAEPTTGQTQEEAGEAAGATSPAVQPAYDSQPGSIDPFASGRVDAPPADTSAAAENEAHPAPIHSEPAPAAARPAARPNVSYESTDAPVEATPANRRDDFISAARRAARMANEAPADELTVGNDQAQEATGVSQKVRRQPSAQKARRPLSRVSMALLCLVAVGASFALVKSTILAPSRTVPAAPAAAPAAAPKAGTQSKGPADKSLQQLDDADVIIENDKKGAAPGPRRSSTDGNGVILERDLANAFDGGTRSAIPASQIQNQGGFTPAMSEFARQNIPASLTPDQSTGAMVKPTDNLPLTIGPNSLRSAASKGDSSAEFEIGARYAEGRGVPQNLEQAVVWFQKSAAQGFAPAQYRLGSMYERGLGVKADLARARVWYQRSAEQGIVKAMHNLAVLTAGRDASATDYEVASKWFKAAADHGLTDSQFNLAIMHDSGLGMPRDAKQAYKWFSLAARAGDEEASRRREALRAKLQPQELTEVEAEIAQWRPRSADQNVNDPRMAGETWKQRVR